MIDTSKPMEFLTGEVWVPCRFVGSMSDGELAIELFDATRITLIRVPQKSGKVRNKPEPKRRPLNDEEMRHLTGIVVVSEDGTLRTTVVASCAHYMMIGLGSTKLSPEELLVCGWRRLDGSGLWVEE